MSELGLADAVRVVSKSTDDDNKGPAKGSIIKPKYKDRYKKHGFSCGDDLADEMKAYLGVIRDGKYVTDLVKLRAVAELNEVWKDSYGSLNPGQQRMNIGNRLRARLEAGEAVDIGGVILRKFCGECGDRLTDENIGTKDGACNKCAK